MRRRLQEINLELNRNKMARRCTTAEFGLRDYDDTCSSVKRSMKTVFECLAANDITHHQRVKITYKLLELLKYSCNCLVEFQLDCDNRVIDLPNEDVLGKLLVSISQCRGIETIDLFASFFAYCSIYGFMRKYIMIFLDSILGKDQMWELLEKLCCFRKSDASFPGFYTIAMYLEMFERIDSHLLEFLDLNLGKVLLKHWIPAWKRWREIEPEVDNTPLKLLVSRENLLMKSLNEADLDFWICNLQHHQLVLDNEKNFDIRPLNYFLFKLAKRSLKFQEKLTLEYSEFVRNFVTKNLGNDSFQKLNMSDTFFYQVIMEVLDHPEVNFFEEPHLTNLLRVSLTYFWDQCVRQRNIDKLHYILGNLGTTLCLPSLLGSLQYRLSKFLLSVAECVHNGVFLEENVDWFKKLTNFSLPSWFDNVQSKTPPISKSLFCFDNNNIELEQETCLYEESLVNLLTSLQLTMGINECIFQFYSDVNLDILSVREKAYLTQSSSIQNKANAEFFNMCFVPLLSTILLSEQLPGKLTQKTSLLGPTSSVNLKILFRSSIKNIELILQAQGNTALYYLIKFLSQVSLENICLQKQSISLLNHLFFHGNKEFILQICLSNELTTQSLYDYIQLWNDGSPIYSDFFLKVFKRPQPIIERKKLKMNQLVEFLPSNTLGASKNYSAKSKPKFNLNALSFVPHENINSYQRPSYKDQNGSILPGIYGSTSMTVASSNSTPNMSTPMIDASKNVYNGTSLRTQFETWSPPSPILFQTNHQNTPAKLVNTGKSYILGGHNRAANNSRTKSVHVDDFERL